MISYQFIAFDNGINLSFFFQLLQYPFVLGLRAHKSEYGYSSISLLYAPRHSIRLTFIGYNFGFDLFPNFIFCDGMLFAESLISQLEQWLLDFGFAVSGLGQHLSANAYMINDTITCFMQMCAK